MAITLINPAGLPEIDVYRQVSVATGSRIVFVAGQVDWNADGETGSDDLAAQVEQCYANAATALAGVGAGFADVAKVKVYVVDWSPDKMAAIGEGIARASERLGSVPLAPATLIGVAALDVPEHLVELEVTAVLD